MNSDGQPTSSSSFSNVEAPENIESGDKVLTLLNNQESLTSDKIEGSQEEKKLRMDSQPQSKSKTQVDEENKSFIDELTSEMLKKILNYLDVPSLSVSRLVSRKWNEIAREILQSRDDVETVFYCRGIVNLRFEGKTQRANLDNFINYFEDPAVKESPLYTRFRFEGIQPTSFVHADWIRFTRDFGPSVKSLRLVIPETPTLNDMKRLVDRLRNLLLNQLPNLEEFGLQFPDWYLNNPNFRGFSNLTLLPPTTTFTANRKTKFQLPNLKVLYIDEFCFMRYEGIVSDLLDLAVNLQKIEPCNKYVFYKDIETFQFLQSFEKIHCVQSARFEINGDEYDGDGFLAQIKNTPLSSAPFKLKNLHLTVSYDVYKNKTVWARVSKFLINLFESSKDSLKEVEMEPMGFLLALPPPKFSKLQKLFIIYVRISKFHVIPKGLNLNELFPLLQDLELEVPWADFCVKDVQNTSCIPSIKTLKITGDELKEEDIVQISQVCPNLKELQICNGRFGQPIQNFPEVGIAIWTNLTKLESLDLKIDLDDPANSLLALDSCFTGFSRKDCIRLHKLMENQKPVQKQELESEPKKHLKVERKNPSILDLKDLRKLKVSCIYKGIYRDFSRIPKLMSISEELAFKLMENLTYKN